MLSNRNVIFFKQIRLQWEKILVKIPSDFRSHVTAMESHWRFISDKFWWIKYVCCFIFLSWIRKTPAKRPRKSNCILHLVHCSLLVWLCAFLVKICVSINSHYIHFHHIYIYVNYIKISNTFGIVHSSCQDVLTDKL